MAKYRLEKNRKKSVNCEVLYENLNGYIVRFDNGMIKNVKKSNVYALDKIDEAVLDDIRAGLSNFGRRVADTSRRVVDTVKNFFKRVINIDNFVFFRGESGNVLPVSHPINVMEGARGTSSVNFVPCEDDIKYASELGIDAIAVENFQHTGEYNGAIQFNSMNDRYNESYKNSFLGTMLSEVANSERWLAKKDSIQLQGEFGDWSQEQIEEDIISEYAARYTKKHFAKGLLPLMVWGAPGIGKTAIMRACKDKIKSNFGKDIRVISINGGSVGYDDFTMPADIKEKFIEYLNGTEKESERHTLKDLPKSWLPVFDSTSNDAILQNALANGGRLEEYEVGGVKKTKIINGPGGIFFIDEFSRLTQAAISSLMQTPTSREIAGNSTLKFGDRWVIISAANRSSDMAKAQRSEAMVFEAAAKTRFRHVNFVPKLEDWVKWANEKGDDGQTNVMREMIDYLLQEPRDFYEMYNVPKGQLDVDRATACPRTWEAFSAQLRTTYLKQDINDVGDDGEDLSMFKDYFSDRPDSLDSIEIDEITRCGAAIIGGDPTARFAKFVKNLTFTSKDADNVVVYGANDPKGNPIEYKILNNITVANSSTIVKTTIVPLIVDAIKQKGGVTDEMLYHVCEFAYLLANVKVPKKDPNDKDEYTFTKSIFNAVNGEVWKAFNIKKDNDIVNRFPKAIELYNKIIKLKK